MRDPGPLCSPSAPATASALSNAVLPADCDITTGLHDSRFDVRLGPDAASATAPATSAAAWAAGCRGSAIDVFFSDDGGRMGDDVRRSEDLSAGRGNSAENCSLAEAAAAVNAEAGLVLRMLVAGWSERGEMGGLEWRRSWCVEDARREEGMRGAISRLLRRRDAEGSLGLTAACNRKGSTPWARSNARM